jgi:hypothetical protein
MEPNELEADGVGIQEAEVFPKHISTESVDVL